VSTVTRRIRSILRTISDCEQCYPRSPHLRVSVLTVDYFVGGTAASGVDDSALPNRVTSAAGSTQAVITVTPIDDKVHEGT
jgi:hypothetical protein